MTHLKAFFCVAILLPAAASVSTAQIISVNFVGGRSAGEGADSVTRFALAGAFPARNWNNLTGSSGNSVPLVSDPDIIPPGTTITYTSPNTWSGTATAPGDGSNAAMMSGYLDNFSGTNTILVTGLTAAFVSRGYYVVVYQNSDTAGSWGYSVAEAGTMYTRFGLQVTGDGGNYPLPSGFVEGTATTADGGTTASNYVVLRGFNNRGFHTSSFTLRGINGTTGDGRARINGFQIVPVPELGMSVTVASGACALALLRRRRLFLGRGSPRAPNRHQGASKKGSGEKS